MSWTTLAPNKQRAIIDCRITEAHTDDKGRSPHPEHTHTNARLELVTRCRANSLRQTDRTCRYGGA